MSNRLMTREEVAVLMDKTMKLAMAGKLPKPRKQKPEDLTKITDTNLEDRLVFAGGRNEEAASPLIAELVRRYNNKKKEFDGIRQKDRENLCFLD